MEQQQIGARVKNLRKYLKLTQEELAEKCGYTKGMISKIENGKISIPIATLSKIAKALDVKLSWFFEEEEEDNNKLNIIKKSERPKVGSKGNEFGYQYELLANRKKFKKIETFIVTVPIDTEKKLPFSHQEEEFAFVIEGAIDLVYGSEIYELEKGDSAYYHGDKEHMFRSKNNQEAQVLVIFIIN
ncbi:hypothetical protein BTR23_03970 [Alkalihalophilus pseudofirmus]|nr:hypothetical protein BTR23_03970 [Alkalihalophilus pseudofirmus]